MKCTYRYAIKGTLKVSGMKPIRLRHMDYEFETDNDIVKAIRITSSIAEDEWPRIVPSTRSPGKYGIDLQNHRMTFIHMEIRGLEAILSLYGVTEIDTHNWKIELVPETEDERKALPFFEFKQQTSREAPPLDPILNQDRLSKLIAACLYVELGPLTFPLSFFRKARISMMEGRFISAYYDFYFVLETLYGNGKTKNYAIVEEFKKSPHLQRAAKESLDFSVTNFPDEVTRANFVKRFKDHNTSDSLIKCIVDRRGFLHHHTARNRRIWHPSHEKEFETDALMIQELAMRVLIDEVSLLFEDQRVKADLERR